jgi:hypothetical protein
MALEYGLSPEMLRSIPSATLTRLARSELPAHLRGPMLDEMHSRVKKFANGGAVTGFDGMLDNYSTDQLQFILQNSSSRSEQELVQNELGKRATTPTQGAPIGVGLPARAGQSELPAPTSGLQVFAKPAAADYVNQSIQPQSGLQSQVAPAPQAPAASGIQAYARQAPASPPPPAKPAASGTEAENSLWENPALITGLALMANRSPSLMGALGEAGMVGARFAGEQQQRKQRAQLFGMQTEKYRADVEQEKAKTDRLAQIRAGLAPEMRPLFDLDPSGYAKGVQERAFAVPKAPDVRTVRRGNQDVSLVFNAATGGWDELASGSAFAPTQPREAPEAWRLMSPEEMQAGGFTQPMQVSTRGRVEAAGVAPDRSLVPVADPSSSTGVRLRPRGAAEGQEAPTTSGNVQQTNGALPSDMAGKAAALKVVAQDLPTFESFYFPEGKYAGRIAAGTAAYPTVGQFLDPGAGAIRTKMLGALDAALRIKTGAGMNKEEIPFYENQYIPGPSDNEQTARAKLDGLRSFVAETTEEIDRSRKGGPQAAGPQQPSGPQAPGNAFTQRGQPAPQPQASTPPAPGMVTEGNGGVRYRFIGVDPGKRANWERI